MNAETQLPIYHILIVDDDSFLLDMTKSILEQDNYRITTCSNPIVALELLKKNFYQLIICDYIMPELDGGELLKQARFMHPSTLRILLTAHNDVDAVIKAVKSGAVYKFILKPWDSNDFRMNIALALEQYELTQKNMLLQKKYEENLVDIEKLSASKSSNRGPLARMLHKHGLLSVEKVLELLKSLPDFNSPVIDSIIDRGWLTEYEIHSLIHEILGIQIIDLEKINIKESVARLVSPVLCQQHSIIPVELSGKQLTVAMRDPLDFSIIENLRFLTGLEIVPVMSTRKAIALKIETVYQCRDLQESKTLLATKEYLSSDKSIIILYGNDTFACEGLKNLLHHQFNLNTVLLPEQSVPNGKEIKNFENYALQYNHIIILLTQKDLQNEESSGISVQLHPNMIYKLGWLKGHINHINTLLLLHENIPKIPYFDGIPILRFSQNIIDHADGIRQYLESTGIMKIQGIPASTSVKKNET